jgi:LacI family transcriptional regulator
MRGISHYAIAHGPWEFVTQVPGLSVIAVREWEVDGIIVPLRSAEYARLFRERGIPTVNCSGVLENSGLPTVHVDDCVAGQMAAAHLLELGFRRFGYCGYPDFHFAAVRGEGFTEALREHGFEAVVHQPDAALKLEWTWDRQEEDLARWLKTLDRPIGIMACNDERAWQLAEASRRVGLRVPEEVALIGVDNDELRCEFSTPPLSAVAVPAERIGYESAAMLDRLMEGGPPDLTPVLVRPRGVVARRSTDVLAFDDEAVGKAFRFIRENLATPFGPDDVVREVGSGRESLDDKFQHRFGRSLEDEIVRARVQRAERILAETDLELPQVAQATGFRTATSFTAMFRRQTGLSPRAYREKFRAR